MDYKGLAEQLVKKCLKQGADAAEVYIESGRNLSVEVRNGEIETVQEAAAAGVGVRVFVKGRMAFASCNDLKEASLDHALSRAIEFARSTTPDPNNVLPSDTGVTSVEGLYDPAIAQVSMEKKIELMKNIEKLAIKDPRITKSAGAGYSESEDEVFLANSNGLSKSYKSSACSVGVSVVAEKPGQQNTGGEYCSRRFYADLKPPAEIAARAARGLLLTDVTGYGINPVNGNFSGGASGLWIENGKVAFPVKGVTIASTAAEMLNGIDMVGTDLDLNRGFAAPTFRIREMQIGGE